MKYINYFFQVVLLLCLSSLIFQSCKSATVNESKNKMPNIVLILLDDGAFDDFSPFGNPRYPTPHVKTLAREGRSFYNFYVPQAICSASRAVLLTGCYPGRTKVFGAHGPGEPGLDPSFATLAEALKKNGYTTGSFGKWHLGDQPGRRPLDRGFDESCGLMYSNDMWNNHPTDGDYFRDWPLQFWENDKITIDSVDEEDQKMLTTWYTEQAVDFVDRHQDEPFFLYLAHSMPHVPIYCSGKFEGKSGTGLYGDVMMELDWSVGQVNQALKKHGLEENTMVIFIASDNGPWLAYGDHAGITGFREGKATGFDGGLRNPCIIKYPGVIDAGTKSHKMLNSVDILPTVCKLTGTDLPNNEIDGKNVWEIVLDQSDVKNPHDYYPFSTGKIFEGVISGNGYWKLHLPHPYRALEAAGTDGLPGKYENTSIDTSLYDLIHDPYEKGNVLSKYSDKSALMLKWAEQHRSTFFEDQE